MDTTKTCQHCGKPIGPEAAGGLCPQCMMKVGLGSEVSSDTRPPGPEGQRRTGFVPPAVAELAKHFPQLEVIELLGQGGMGAVYKARQPALDRLVALKILSTANRWGRRFRRAFTREARALAKLSHPNIVGVHEFGQVDGLHYFLMEYVDGPNLRQIEQAGKLPPPQALKLIPQICEALQFAHDEGIVHRDIKPENVLVDKKGRVKIADFGLAKILGREPKDLRLTGAKDVMGTPVYMAPEQIEHPREVDHRADIYSLGVVFYEMLTGELPLGKFSPPSSRMRGVQVDVRLDEVVLHTLEKEPERRYQHASEVKTDVESIAGSRSAPQPSAGLPFVPAPVAYASGSPIRTATVLGGTIFLLLFLAATGVAIFLPRADLARNLGIGLLVGLVNGLITGILAFVVFSASRSGPMAAGRARSGAPNEAVRRQVKPPAIGLLVTGILNWVLIPLAGLLVVWVVPIELRGAPLGLSNTAVTAGCLGSLLFCSFIIYAALKMMQLEGRGTAIIGSVLAMIVSPGNIIGLPIGIWALVTLARRDVRASFLTLSGRSGGVPSQVALASGSGVWKVAASTAAAVMLLLAISISGMLLSVALPAWNRVRHPAAAIPAADGVVAGKAVGASPVAWLKEAGVDLDKVDIKTAPMTQVSIEDLQADGTSRFRSVIREINDAEEPLHQLQFINSDLVDLRRMVDADGNAIPFTSVHNGQHFNYTATLAKPVAPGGIVIYGSEGVMRNKVDQDPELGTFTYRFRHSPNAGVPVRRVEVHRLPAGAELLEVSPGAARRESDGRIEVVLDKMVRPGGSVSLSYRYRLGEATNSASSVTESREVNKLVSEFPEKTDLSTPETACAAWQLANARKDVQAVSRLSWVSLDPAAEEKWFRDQEARDPAGMAVYLKALAESKIIEVITWRDQLAQVTSYLPFPAGKGRHPYSARVFGLIDGEWKNLGEDRLPSLQEARSNFEEKKERLWKNFENIRATHAKTQPAEQSRSIGDTKNGFRFTVAAEVDIPAPASGPRIMLDLETGRFMSEPDYVEDFKGNARACIAWIREHGLDISAFSYDGSRHGCICYYLAATRVPDARWTEATPGEIVANPELALMIQPKRCVLLADRGKIDTYLIRTQEGTFGILRVLGPDADGHGVRICYKLVLRDNPEAPALAERRQTDSAQGPITGL